MFQCNAYIIVNCCKLVNLSGLYERQYWRFNVHLLLHLVDSVRRFGSLWAHSAFMFEHNNGRLIHYIKCASNYVPEQICKLYFRGRMVERRAEAIFSRNIAFEGAKNFHLKMTENIRVKRCIEFCPHLRLFGKPIEIELDLNVKLIIEIYYESQSLFVL